MFGALDQERKVKAKKIMILNNIGIALLNQVAQVGAQARLVRCRRSFKRRSQPTAVAQRDHKNASVPGVKRGCFKVELEPV